MMMMMWWCVVRGVAGNNSVGLRCNAEQSDKGKIAEEKKPEPDKETKNLCRQMYLRLSAAECLPQRSPMPTESLLTRWKNLLLNSLQAAVLSLNLGDCERRIEESCFNSTSNQSMTMLGSCDCYIDSVVLTKEFTRAGSHSWDEDQIILTALRAVNRYHLIVHVIPWKLLSYSILLGIVRCNYVDAFLTELLHWKVWSVQIIYRRLTSEKFVDYKISEVAYGIHFFSVKEWSALELFLTILHVDE